MIERVLQSAAAFDAGALLQNATLADKLSGERHRWFIARERELLAFDSALADNRCSLLFLSGQTGVGKTAILRELERLAHARSNAVAFVDASELALDHGQLTQPFGRLAGLLKRRKPASEARPVLLVDCYERLGLHDQTLFMHLGQSLPADTLLVIASRKSPPRWLAIDPAWASLARFVQVAPWSEGEAREFLEAQGVLRRLQGAMLDACGTYPLALTVAMHVFRDGGSLDFGEDEIRQVQSSLGELLSIRAGSRGHQLALDVCSLSRRTSFELLEHVLRSNRDSDSSSAHELFEWLRNQTFVEPVGDDLRPHWMARMALIARVRRDQKYQAIFRPIREFLVDQLAAGGNPELHFEELAFLDRDIQAIREQALLPGAGTPFEPSRTTDDDELVALVRRHEGNEAAELCRAVLAARLGTFEVAREEAIERVIHVLELGAPDPFALADRDPALALAQRFWLEHPLEAGQSALLFRWSFARSEYQSLGANVLAIAARQAQLIIARPHIGYSLCVYRTPEEWHAMWDAVHSPHEVVGTFSIGAHAYTLIAFSFTESTLRNRLVDAYSVPAVPRSAVRPIVDSGQTPEEPRGTLERRVAELGRKARLSAREVEVLQQLCVGSTFDEIAQKLSITPRTVRFHQGNLLRKTGASSRLDLFRRLI